MVTEKESVLLAEADRDLSAGCARLLARDGYQVDVAHDGAQAWTRLAAEKYDLMLLSERIGRVDWQKLLDHAAMQDVPVILLRRTPVRLRHLLSPALPAAFLPLPFEYGELRGEIEELMALRASGEQVQAGEYTVTSREFSLGGERITLAEWRILRALAAEAPPEGERVYLDALNQKLSRQNSSWEIRYRDGYRWVKKS